MFGINQLSIRVGSTFTALRGGGSSFSPLDLSPEIWLDASDPSTITEAAGLVSQWDDKSGNSRDVVQATGANQLITNATTVNSLNVLDADGSKFMQTIGAATWLNGGAYNVFAVVSSASSANTMFVGTNQGVADKGLHLGRSGNFVATNQYSDDAAHPYTWTTNPTQLLCQYLDSGSEVYINGSSIGTKTNPINDLNTAGVLNIAAGFRTTADKWSGSIAEIIVVMGPMATQEIADMNQYQIDKWGI